MNKGYRKKLKRYNIPNHTRFVDKPEAWKYSSARNWVLNDHSIIKITKLDSVYTYEAEAS